MMKLKFDFNVEKKNGEERKMRKCVCWEEEEEEKGERRE
jgi:hypothetical protein